MTEAEPLAALDAEIARVADAEAGATTMDELEALRQRRGALTRRRERRARALATADRLDLPEFRLLTLDEAARVLRISPDKAKAMARAGTLPGVVGKIGTRWRVNEGLLLEFVTGEGSGLP